MTILNLMLGRDRGGLEQAALDYAEALALAQIQGLTVISPNAWVEAPLVAASVAHETLSNHGRLDIFAPQRLRSLAKKTSARAVICHGNRALQLALRALHGQVPIVAVAHNYSTRRFAQADACFAITQHLSAHLIASGAKNISLMPNMVRIPPAPTAREAFRTPPIIGSMGRFVAKKGFPTFIEALSILRHRGVAFRAILGGDGEEAAAIDDHIARYQLKDSVTRMGWVKDKGAFFHGIDLFVLPSHHEPFGIALIEAMAYGVPVISSDTEGPSEILHHGETGMLVRKKDPEALADAMEKMLNSAAHAAQLGKAGAAHVARTYSMDAMAKRLQLALNTFI